MHTFRIILNDILLMFSEQEGNVGYKYLFDIILNKNSHKFILLKYMCLYFKNKICYVC